MNFNLHGINIFTELLRDGFDLPFHADSFNKWVKQFEHRYVKAPSKYKNAEFVPLFKTYQTICRYIFLLAQKKSGGKLVTTHTQLATHLPQYDIELVDGKISITDETDNSAFNSVAEVGIIVEDFQAALSAPDAEERLAAIVNETEIFYGKVSTFLTQYAIFAEIDLKKFAPHRRDLLPSKAFMNMAKDDDLIFIDLRKFMAEVITYAVREKNLSLLTISFDLLDNQQAICSIIHDIANKKITSEVGITTAINNIDNAREFVLIPTLTTKLLTFFRLVNSSIDGVSLINSVLYTKNLHLENVFRKSKAILLVAHLTRNVKVENENLIRFIPQEISSKYYREEEVGKAFQFANSQPKELKSAALTKVYEDLSFALLSTLKVMDELALPGRLSSNKKYQRILAYAKKLCHQKFELFPHDDTPMLVAEFTKENILEDQRFHQYIDREFLALEISDVKAYDSNIDALECLILMADPLYLQLNSHFEQIVKLHKARDPQYKYTAQQESMLSMLESCWEETYLSSFFNKAAFVKTVTENNDKQTFFNLTNTLNKAYYFIVEILDLYAEQQLVLPQGPLVNVIQMYQSRFTAEDLEYFNLYKTLATLRSLDNESSLLLKTEFLPSVEKLKNYMSFFFDFDKQIQLDATRRNELQQGIFDHKSYVPKKQKAKKQDKIEEHEKPAAAPAEPEPQKSTVSDKKPELFIANPVLGVKNKFSLLHPRIKILLQDLDSDIKVTQKAYRQLEALANPPKSNRDEKEEKTVMYPQHNASINELLANAEQLAKEYSRCDNDSPASYDNLKALEGSISSLKETQARLLKSLESDTKGIKPLEVLQSRKPMDKLSRAEQFQRAQEKKDAEDKLESEREAKRREEEKQERERVNKEKAEKKKANIKKSAPVLKHPSPTPMSSSKLISRALDEKKSQKSVPEEGFYKRTRNLHLNEAIKNLIYIDSILNIDTNVKTAATVMHFALLYNIFRCFQSLKSYLRFGGKQTTSLNDEVITDLRNGIIHLGASVVNYEDVKNFALTIRHELPKELNATRSIWQLTLTDSQRDLLVTTFGLVKETDKFRYLMEGLIPVLETTALYKALHKFHSKPSHPLTTQEQLKKLTESITSMNEILQRIKMTPAEAMTMQTDFLNYYLVEIHALRMLVTICGDLSGLVKVNDPALKNFLTECCRTERNIIGHEPLDVEDASMAINFFIRLRTGLSTIDVSKISKPATRLSATAAEFFPSAMKTEASHQSTPTFPSSFSSVPGLTKQ